MAIGICSICKKKRELDRVNRFDICESCFDPIKLIEVTNSAYKQWKDTIDSYDKYNNRTDIMVNAIIKKISNTIDIKKQAELLLERIEEMIQECLQFYLKDDLVVAILTIRELIRRLIIKKDVEWEILTDIQTTNTLLEMTNRITDTDFKNNFFDFKDNDFISAICLTRRYNMITDNLKMNKKATFSLSEVCFNPLRTDETENYFSEFLVTSIEEKPEDYQLINETLKKRLEVDRKTPKTIIDGLQDFLFDEFGFKTHDYSTFIQFAKLFDKSFATKKSFAKFKNKKDLFIDCPLIILDKEKLEDIEVTKHFKALKDIFSLKKALNSSFDINTLELFSFYEVNNLLVFGFIDFVQNISAFEKFLLSSHYCNIFKKGISENEMLIKAQRHLSTFFSYSIADCLFYNGYKLPIEKYQGKMIPRAEIDKIIVDKKNILKQCGDIDVLAINPNTKVIILLELKYYKPAADVHDMIYRDETRIQNDDVIRKIKAREQIVINNIDGVVSYILSTEDYGYTVKSVLVTARPNYFAINDKQIPSFTWSQLLTQIENKQL
jgi:hypothetical protein